jgi:hypothetical protein
MHTDVFARLGVEVGRAEKQAGLASQMFQGARRMAGGVASRAASPFIGAASRVGGAASAMAGSPGRAARTLAYGAGGALGAGHAYNQINDMASDPEHRFATAQKAYAAQLPAQQQALASRRAYEQGGEYNAWYNRLGRAVGLGGQSAADIRRDMTTGNFGGSRLALGGLNPFAQRHAGYHLDQAGQAAAEMSRRYEAAASPVDHSTAAQQLGELHQQLGAAQLPEQRQMIQEEMGRLQRQLSAPQGMESPYARQLRHRMQAAGMADPTGGSYGAPPPGGFGGMSPRGAGLGDTPYATLSANPWSLDDRIRRYALDPSDTGESQFRARPGIGG